MLMLPIVNQTEATITFHRNNRRVGDDLCRRVREEYIHLNPEKSELVSDAPKYSYRSAHPGFDLDGIPQRLKSRSLLELKSQRCKHCATWVTMPQPHPQP